MAVKPEYLTKTVTRQKTDKFVDEEGNEQKKVTRYKEEVTFRVDAAYVPESIADVSYEFIENYCDANDEGDWLLEKVDTVITDKNGASRDYPFVNLRSDFVKKFFPDIIVGERSNENSIKARAHARFAKKKK